jgi:hypothetical protein
LASRSFRNCCGPVERWWNPASILAYWTSYITDRII